MHSRAAGRQCRWSCSLAASRWHDDPDTAPRLRSPSLLTADQVARIIGAATKRWTDVALDEVTLEANPSAREAPDWGGLLAAGVNRLSLGLQSLRDPELRTLTRGHTAGEGLAALAAARRAGFANVSIDLI